MNDNIEIKCPKCCKVHRFYTPDITLRITAECHKCKVKPQVIRNRYGLPSISEFRQQVEAQIGPPPFDLE